MQEKNTITRNYLSSPERFAQIFNVAVFQGEPIIDPRKLKSLDSTESTILENLHNELTSRQKSAEKPYSAFEYYRDIIKKYDDRTLLIIC